MLFNISIQMKLNFHKINSFFSSIHWLILIGSAQQHRAQGKQKVLYAFSYKFKLCKEKIFQNCYLSSTFVLKLEPNPNLVLESELKFLNFFFWKPVVNCWLNPQLWTFFKNQTRTGSRVPLLCGTRTILMFIYRTRSRGSS